MAYTQQPIPYRRKRWLYNQTTMSTSRKNLFDCTEHKEIVGEAFVLRYYWEVECLLHRINGLLALL